MASSAPIRTDWHPGKNHSDIERWICVYPAYINNKKTRQEGRRLPKEACVENPTYMEIRDVMSVANVPITVENKQYCRERSRELQFRGRIRVQMRNDDGSLCNSDLYSREAIFRYIANKIPQLKSRQSKIGESFQVQPQSSSTSCGKKGKGKRR